MIKGWEGDPLPVRAQETVIGPYGTTTRRHQAVLGLLFCCGRWRMGVGETQTWLQLLCTPDHWVPQERHSSGTLARQTQKTACALHTARWASSCGKPLPESTGVGGGSPTGSQSRTSQMLLDNSKELRTKWEPRGAVQPALGTRGERDGEKRGCLVVPVQGKSPWSGLVAGNSRKFSCGRLAL